jgi:nucleotide-binding universal stress UspA family protein
VIPPYMPPAAAEEAAVLYAVYSPAQYRKETQAQATKMLERARAEAKARKVACDIAFVTSGEPWQAIVKAARSKKCDLIVMASHGRRGLSGLLLGSETTKVLTHSKTPVLVCR